MIIRLDEYGTFGSDGVKEFTITLPSGKNTKIILERDKQSFFGLTVTYIKVLWHMSSFFGKACKIGYTIELYKNGMLHSTWEPKG